MQQHNPTSSHRRGVGAEAVVVGSDPSNVRNAYAATSSSRILNIGRRRRNEDGDDDDDNTEHHGGNMVDRPTVQNSIDNDDDDEEEEEQGRTGIVAGINTTMRRTFPMVESRMVSTTTAIPTRSKKKRKRDKAAPALPSQTQSTSIPGMLDVGLKPTNSQNKTDVAATKDVDNHSNPSDDVNEGIPSPDDNQVQDTSIVKSNKKKKRKKVRSKQKNIRKDHRDVKPISISLRPITAETRAKLASRTYV
jgi:Holliday junction resolvase RusA-like endonuclease